MRLLLPLVVLLLSLLVPSGAAAQETEKAVRDIAGQLKCPVCQNISVADSPTELAGQMRDIVQRKVEAGESREQILSYFVARYGEEVLREPPKRGFNLVLWIGPILILLGSAVVLFRTVSRWRHRAADEIGLDSWEATRP